MFFVTIIKLIISLQFSSNLQIIKNKKNVKSTLSIKSKIQTKIKKKIEKIEKKENYTSINKTSLNDITNRKTKFVTIKKNIVKEC